MSRRAPVKRASRVDRRSALPQERTPARMSSDLVPEMAEADAGDGPDDVLLSRAERFALLEARRLLEPLVGKDVFRDLDGFFARVAAVDVGANAVRTVTVRISKQRAPELTKEAWFKPMFASLSRDSTVASETNGEIVSSLETQPDGAVLLSFQAVNLPAVARWVSRWGADAQVLEPSQLVAIVQRQVARAKPRPNAARGRARQKGKPRVGSRKA